MISANQRAILRLIAQGESNEGVEAQLKLDPEAFRNCLNQLFGELGVTTRVELMFFACSEKGRLLLQDEAGGVGAACARPLAILTIRPVLPFKRHLNHPHHESDEHVVKAANDIMFSVT